MGLRVASRRAGGERLAGGVDDTVLVAHPVEEAPVLTPEEAAGSASKVPAS